jgi:hypothetical protein
MKANFHAVILAWRGGAIFKHVAGRAKSLTAGEGSIILNAALSCDSYGNKSLEGREKFDARVDFPTPLG